MKKQQFSNTIAPAIVIIICIVLAVNTTILNVKLGKAESKAVFVKNLEGQVLDLRSKLEEQRIASEELKKSLSEADKDLEDFRVINADLESRLKGALDALQGPSGEVK
ncbi:MAG: hypothetical protein ABIG92_04235 [Candidatus Omnitrophota bacterium]